MKTNIFKKLKTEMNSLVLVTELKLKSQNKIKIKIRKLENTKVQ